MTSEPIPISPKKPTAVTSAMERQSSNWDLQNAPHNYFWLIVGQGGTAVVSFMSVWVIIRFLGSEGYGGIVAFVAASQFIQIFVNWSATALTRFGIAEFVETGMITKAFWTRCLMFFPSLLLVLASSFIWLHPLASAVKLPDSALLLIIVHILVASVWLHMQHALQGVKMLRLQSFLLVVERVLTLLTLLILVISDSVGWESVALCYIGPPIVVSLVAVFVLSPFINLRGFPVSIQLASMFRFSLPLIPFALVGYFASSQLDAFFLTNFLSAADLGRYSVASQINGMLFQVPVLANSILFSLFISLKHDGKEDLIMSFFGRLVPSVTLVWGFISLLIASIGAVFIAHIFGSEFETLSVPLWILFCSTCIAFPVLAGLATLASTYDKTYVSMYASFVGALTNVILNLLLIPRYGLIGCAWATAIASFTCLTTYYVLLRKQNLIRGNWIYQAILPIILSSFIYSWTENVFLSLAVAFVCTLGVAVFNKESLRFSFTMMCRLVSSKKRVAEPDLNEI